MKTYNKKARPIPAFASLLKETKIRKRGAKFTERRDWEAEYMTLKYKLLIPKIV